MKGREVEGRDSGGTRRDQEGRREGGGREGLRRDQEGRREGGGRDSGREEGDKDLCTPLYFLHLH